MARFRTRGPLTRLGVALALFAVVAGCGNRAEMARETEIRLLAHQNFAQAAEPGRCVGGCAAQEAGFAYAKAHAMTQDNDCVGKGDEDFLEGCRQYGEDIQEAYESGLNH